MPALPSAGNGVLKNFTDELSLWIIADTPKNILGFICSVMRCICFL